MQSRPLTSPPTIMPRGHRAALDLDPGRQRKNSEKSTHPTFVTSPHRRKGSGSQMHSYGSQMGQGQREG